MSWFNEWWCGFKRGTHDFGAVLNVLVNSTLLFLVYVIGVGVSFIITKSMGKQFMSLKQNKRAKTYWSTLNTGKKKMDKYYRQF